jgi:hypothetical protein
MEQAVNAGYVIDALLGEGGKEEEQEEV